MKIKKINEKLDSQLPIKEIERIRNNHFNKEETEYTLYGEELETIRFRSAHQYYKI